MSNSHRIDIEPISLGQRGHLYRVYHAGAVLIPSSRNPEFDACRLVLANGIVGQLVIWHLGAKFPAMRIDIVKGAGLTVEDSDCVGPRFAPWRPRSEDAANALPSSAVSSRTAEDQLPVGSGPRPRTALRDAPPEQIFNPRFRGLRPGSDDHGQAQINRHSTRELQGQATRG
jgi:hypothetical protein